VTVPSLLVYVNLVRTMIYDESGNGVDTVNPIEAQVGRRLSYHAFSYGYAAGGQECPIVSAPEGADIRYRKYTSGSGGEACMSYVTYTPADPGVYTIGFTDPHNGCGETISVNVTCPDGYAAVPVEDEPPVAATAVTETASTSRSTSKSVQTSS